MLSHVRAVNKSRLPLTDRIRDDLFGSHFKKAVNTSSPVRAPAPRPVLSALPVPAAEAKVSALGRVPFVLEQKEHEDLLVLRELVPISTLWCTIL